MQINMCSDLRPYIEEILQGKAVLFLGAGSAKEAGAPTADELAEEIAKKFNFSVEYKTLDDLCLWIQEYPNTWVKVLNYIKSKLDNLNPNEAYLKLCKYPWRAIFTTNWDTLVEDACGDAVQPIRTNGEYKLYTESNNKKIPLFKLHGCVKLFGNEVEGSPIFSKADKEKEKVLAFRKLLFSQLAQYAATTTVVVIGWGFNDEEVLSCFKNVSPRKGYPHLLVDPKPYYPESYYERYGFKILKKKFSEFMEFLDSYCNSRDDSTRENMQNCKQNRKIKNTNKENKNYIHNSSSKIFHNSYINIDNTLSFIASQISRILTANQTSYDKILDREYICKILESINMSNFKEYISEIINSFEIKGVINPNYLRDLFEKKIYMYFIRSREGMYLALKSFLRNIKDAVGEYSIYITFGPCDIILTHYATEEEKINFISKIHETFEGFGDCFDIHTISRVRYFKGYKSCDYKDEKIDISELNKSVENYESTDTKTKKKLLKNGILLGPAVIEDINTTNRIYAFIGIKFNGPLPYMQDKLEERLLESKWRDVVRSIYDCDGRFNTVLEVICNSVSELNEFTEDLQGIGEIMTTTYVVADVDKENLPKIPTNYKKESENILLQYLNNFSEYIDSNSLEIFREDISNLTSVEISVLDYFIQRITKIDLNKLDKKCAKRIRESISLFIEGVVRGSETKLSASIISLSVVLEEVGRSALKALVEKVYGREYGKAQKELRLPSRKFKDLGLYDIQKAFEIINRSDRYKDIIPIEIPAEFFKKLDSLRRFRADIAHRIPDMDYQYFIRLASNVYIDGIEVIDWLNKNILLSI